MLRQNADSRTGAPNVELTRESLDGEYPIVVSKMIATDVAAMSRWALEVAPMAALTNIDSATGMLSLLARRLRVFGRNWRKR
jgi:hypothetical protein